MQLKLFVEELRTAYAWLQVGICRQLVWRPAIVSQSAIELMREGGLAVSACDRMALIEAQNWAKVMDGYK